MVKTLVTDVRPYFKTNGSVGTVLVTAKIKHGTRKFFASVEGSWTHEGLEKTPLFWLIN